MQPIHTHPIENIAALSVIIRIFYWLRKITQVHNSIHGIRCEALSQMYITKRIKLSLSSHKINPPGFLRSTTVLKGNVLGKN